MFDSNITLDGVWTQDDIDYIAWPLIDTWKSARIGLGANGDFERDSTGDLSVPGQLNGSFESEDLPSLDRKTREYFESKGCSVEKEYLPILRSMYNKHLRITYYEEIFDSSFEPPDKVWHRFMSDGTKLLYARSMTRLWRDQDERIDRELGVLRKYDGPGGDVVIPDSVTIIAERAFESCADVTSVVIPASVRRIEMHAFANCRNLNQVTIQGKDTQLGFCSFFGGGLVFYGPEFSPAQRYALEHGIRFRVTEWYLD